MCDCILCVFAQRVCFEEYILMGFREPSGGLANTLLQQERGEHNVYVCGLVLACSGALSIDVGLRYRQVEVHHSQSVYEM